MAIDPELHRRHVAVCISHHCDHHIDQDDQVKEYEEKDEVNTNSGQVWSIGQVDIEY